MDDVIVKEQVGDGEDEVEESSLVRWSANNGFVPELFVTKSTKDTHNTLRQNKLR